MNDSKIYVGKSAEYLNVSIDTLRRWDKSGKLKAIRVGSKKGVGERRYRREDIIKIIVNSSYRKKLNTLEKLL